jgi:uncharacterized membrane protein YfbV (UPF0208 family)
MDLERITMTLAEFAIRLMPFIIILGIIAHKVHSDDTHNLEARAATLVVERDVIKLQLEQCRLRNELSTQVITTCIKNFAKKYRVEDEDN